MGLFDTLMSGTAQNLANSIPIQQIPGWGDFKHIQASIAQDPARGQWSYTPGQTPSLVASMPSPFLDYVSPFSMGQFIGAGGNTTGFMPSLKDLPWTPPIPTDNGNRVGQPAPTPPPSTPQPPSPSTPVTPPTSPTTPPVPGSVPPAVPGPTPDKGVSALGFAKQQLGDPYLWGGTSPSGFDCSGLTQYAYKQAGVNIPRTSQEQYAATANSRITNPTDLQAGDLVFFATDSTGTASHVGIYVGNGQMISAPDVGQPVQYANITNPAGYWFQHFMGGGRVE